MREYLFRGKTPVGKWVYGSLILAGSYCCILESEENVHPMDYPYLDNEIGWIDGKATPVIPETVGQYTGRTDKRGNKIFEGDIVRGLMDWGPGGFEEAKALITFHDDGGYHWEYFDTDTIEVISNAYDYPDFMVNYVKEITE